MGMMIIRDKVREPSDNRALTARRNRISPIGNARTMAAGTKIESLIANFYLTAKACRTAFRLFRAHSWLRRTFVPRVTMILGCSERAYPVKNCRPIASS